MSEPANAGWGWDRFSYTRDEVVTINTLMDLNGGSIYDAIKSHLAQRRNAITPEELEVLRLVYIAESRGRMLKSLESFENGVKCSDVSYSSDQNDRVN